MNHHEEPLSLKHQELLAPRLRKIHSPVAEYSFANLYLFRQSHEYSVLTCDDGEIFIKGTTYDGHSYIMPTRPVMELSRDTVTALLDEVEYLFPIASEWLPFFDESVFGNVCADGDMDYIYTAEKMSTYKGRKLHKKRNLLKQFKQSYTARAEPLCKNRHEDAKNILRQWQEDVGVPVEETDYEACMEAIDLMEELVICGIIYYVEDEPAAFILGEELSEETFSLHFAKANKKFKGIYQFMYNDFARLLPRKYQLLNFEQDLGKRALAQAKSSYVPDIMLRKYRVFLKR